MQLNGKKFAASILIALVAVGMGKYASRSRESVDSAIESEQPTAAPETANEATPDATDPHHRPAKPAITAKPTPTSVPDYAKKPEDNIIEFSVSNGWAIAYGDVLLGKVEEGATIKKGYHEAAGPQLWEKPQIPYLIHPDLPHPERVEAALEILRKNTPVQFIARTDQADAIVFEPGEEHCYSYLGKLGGLQPIRLSPGCRPQEILHEVMHALGFIHEQSRPDRDRFVEVQWQNIDPQYQAQFAIVPDSFAEALKDATFDYRSVMLYRPDTFVIRPELTSLRSRGSEPVAPVTQGLSEGDIRRLNRLYNLYE